MDKRTQDIHALLFAEGGALTYKQLAKLLSIDEHALKVSLNALENHLKETGLALIQSDTEVALAIAPNARETVTRAVQSDLDKDIGNAGLEILAIVLYEGPSTRAHIDYIRGVNSSSTIRSLLARGLLERSGNPEDGREFIYRPTTELLAHLGVGKREELPDYATILAQLAAFKASTANHGSEPGAE